jgi:hypothetical protein
MPFNIKFAAGVLDKLLTGKSDELGDILAHKLESMGEDLLMEFVGGPLGAAQRVSTAVATGGQSEFDKARDEFLRGLKPGPLPHAGLIRKVGRLFGAGGGGGRSRRPGQARPGSWQASSWASSREDWLDKQWQHDWRSQPRDILGRWIPGRLEYISSQLQYRGKRAGRKTLRRRKLRKLRKIATRRELRKLMNLPSKRRRKNTTGDAM